MEFFRVFYTGLRVSDTPIQLMEALRFAEQAAWCRKHGLHKGACKLARDSGLMLRNPDRALAD